MMESPINQQMKGNQDHFIMQGLTVLKPNHQAVIELQQQGLMPQALGARVWHASFLLIQYLSTLSLSSEQNITEIGCGWGLPATYLRKSVGANVTAMDEDAQVAHVQQLNSRQNGVKVPFVSQSFEQMNATTLMDIDLMIGADICYSNTNAVLLTELIHDYMDNAQGQVIIADSGRKPFVQLVNALERSLDTQLSEITIALPTPVTGQILHIGNC